MLHELHEILVLRGSEVEAIEDGIRVAGVGHVLFVESFNGEIAAGEGETTVLALAVAADPPDGCAVLDLVGRRIHGATEGPLVDSVREFCRKRGIRFAPGPWRYPGGLV